jgi:hypothetical protein
VSLAQDRRARAKSNTKSTDIMKLISSLLMKLFAPNSRKFVRAAKMTAGLNSEFGCRWAE